MTERYYLDQPVSEDRAMLIGPEAHHLIHVMRAKVGQRVTLFDGTGTEYEAEVRHVGRTEAELTVLRMQRVDRELTAPLILGVALPKGDRQKWLIEKVVELGVTRVVPLRTARSVAQPVRQALDRLQRAGIEACKQCGRNRLLDLAEPADWPDFLAACREIPQRFLAHPAREEGKTPQRVAMDLAAEKPAVFAVGPEGGFAPDETALALAEGWRPLDLGPRVLRVETAALMVASIAARHQTRA